MAQLPVQFLHDDMITKDNLKVLINTTYDLFAGSNDHHQRMKESFLSMVENGALVWSLRHFFRECDTHNWNLAIAFAEKPKEFQKALENDDILGYYATITDKKN